MALDYSYVGSGKMYMRIAGSAAGLVEVGNVSDLKFSVDEDVKELKDFTQAGGGSFSEVRRINKVGIAFTATDFSPQNLARAVFGSSAAVTTTSVVDEAYTGYKNGFIPLLNNASAVTAVKHTTGTPTYVAGTDYEVRSGGVFILSAGAIADGQALKISYTRAAADVIQAITQGAQEYEIAFAGVNEARSGKEVFVNAYRVKLGAAKELALIGSDFGSLEFDGVLLKDVTKTGGVSQYFKASVVQ